MKNIASFFLLTMVGTSSFASTIVSEDFESYSDTASLGVVWNLGDGTIDTGFGNPGQSLDHPATGANFSGANTNSITFPGVYPGEGETLILQGDIYDDGFSSNERNSIGIRTAAGANIIEMGIYNNPSHYAIRTALFGSGSDSSWVNFPGLPTQLFMTSNGLEELPTSVQGWHRFRAEITDVEITFTIDLNTNGSIDSTLVAATTQNQAFLFDQIRLGGPSDVNSVGGVKFDNISLALIPEPVSATLVMLSMIGYVAAFGRQRD